MTLLLSLCSTLLIILLILLCFIFHLQKRLSESQEVLFNKVNSLRDDYSNTSKELRKYYSIVLPQLSYDFSENLRKFFVQLDGTLSSTGELAPLIDGLVSELATNVQYLESTRKTLIDLVDQLDFGEAETFLIALRVFSNRYPKDRKMESFHKACLRLSAEVTRLVDGERFRKIDQNLDPTMREKTSLEARYRTPEQIALAAEKVRLLKEKLKYMKSEEKILFQKQVEKDLLSKTDPIVAKPRKNNPWSA